jgi:nucleoside-diphosphate-sugar epimerase
MKYLILGSNGFIGSSIAEDERFKNRILVSTRQKKENIVGDIGWLNDENIEIIKLFSPEIIINSAWSGVGQYSLEYALNNINSHLKFIEKISKISSIKKYINFGSAWECSAFSEKCNEQNCFSTRTEFLLAKKIIFDYSNLMFEKKHIWLRLFYVYGIYQNKGLFKYIIKSILNNQPVVLKSPLSSVDFISINSVKEYIYQFSIKSIDTSIYNIGSGFPCRIIDILEYIENKIHEYLNINHGNLARNINNKNCSEFFWADMTKTQNAIGQVINNNLFDDIDKMILYEIKRNSNFKNSP